ncbi:MAG: 5'-3' exonuclease H3TH domain-containing protein, partial [Candidatus Pacebacteria bacterium]|nr:5'-3' exonuclease H3TH domain-containing protein [Candidatus Paceibacterota bacterium]
KRLLIIDSNSIIHRAYHALPPLTTKKKELVNAVYGFLLVFFTALKDFWPDFIVAAFDYPAPTFRHKKYKEYKAKRPRAPEELYNQIPKVKEVLRGFSVQVFEKEGFEADDIIGTVATLSPRKQVIPPLETIILSGDLDTLQLVNPGTKVYALRKGVKDVVLYDEKLVEEKFQGLLPRQILDYKALRGDASDNIPGVTGVGEKTAIALLLEFGTLENLYKEIEENSEKSKKIKPKLKETLLKYKEQAFLSKTLAQIEKNSPIDFNLEKCRWQGYDREKISEILNKFEFYSLLNRLPETNGKDVKKPIGENLRLW